MAGLLLYQRLTSPIDAADLLALAADVEGHPDNAAAALLGGLTISCQRDDGRVTARAWPWPAAVQMVVATPDVELETAHARRVLPDTVTLRDAVFNLQRALLLVHALGVGRPRRSARGAARSLAPAGARGARPRAVRSARARRRRGPRRLPQRRRAVDRGVHRRPCTRRAGAAERYLPSPRRAEYDQGRGCAPASRQPTGDNVVQSMIRIHQCISLSVAISARPSTPPKRSGSAASASARWKSPTTTPPSRRCCRARLIASRARNLWRYRELLPIAGEPRTGLHSGFTPLVKAERLAASARRPRAVREGRLGQPSDLFVQGSRRVGGRDPRRRARLHDVRLRVDRQSRRQRRVARRAARAAVRRVHPRRSRAGQGAGAGVYRPQIIAVRGNYDDVNRLCTQVADRYGWGFANINLRAYYAEGAKTYGFEIAEQLGWRFPRHVVSPVAGGTLLPRILKGFEELGRSAWSTASCRRSTPRRRPAARRSIRALEAGLEFPDPVKPNTIAKSIAIGNPADGFQVLRAVRQTGGTRRDGRPTTRSSTASSCWRETEGIFTEPAGGDDASRRRES